MGWRQRRDVWWWHKANASLRESIVRGMFRKTFSTLVVTEYPKSGGTWLSHMLESASGIRYPRDELPSLESGILHGCWLHPHPGHRTIAVLRDGRDVMVSYYFHLIVPRPTTSTRYSAAIRDHLGITEPLDVVGNLPRFIDWVHRDGFPHFTWGQFVDRWLDDEQAVVTSYERLKSDAAGELARILDELGLDVPRTATEKAAVDFDFQRMSRGRTPGTEDASAFVRKGIVGDWRNRFSREAADVFQHWGGAQLAKAGYVSDGSWIALTDTPGRQRQRDRIGPNGRRR